MIPNYLFYEQETLGRHKRMMARAEERMLVLGYPEREFFRERWGRRLRAFAAWVDGHRFLVSEAARAETIEGARGANEQLAGLGAAVRVIGWPRMVEMSEQREMQRRQTAGRRWVHRRQNERRVGQKERLLVVDDEQWDAFVASMQETKEPVGALSMRGGEEGN